MGETYRRIDVWCPTCHELDSRVLAPGQTLGALYCAHCGDALATPRRRDYREQAWRPVFERARDIVIAAQSGRGAVETAVMYARAAARIAFDHRLVEPLPVDEAGEPIASPATLPL